MESAQTSTNNSRTFFLHRPTILYGLSASSFCSHTTYKNIKTYFYEAAFGIMFWCILQLKDLHRLSVLWVVNDQTQTLVVALFGTKVPVCSCCRQFLRGCR